MKGINTNFVVIKKHEFQNGDRSKSKTFHCIFYPLTFPGMKWSHSFFQNFFLDLKILRLGHFCHSWKKSNRKLGRNIILNSELSQFFPQWKSRIFDWGPLMEETKPIFPDINVRIPRCIKLNSFFESNGVCWFWCMEQNRQLFIGVVCHTLRALDWDIGGKNPARQLGFI